MVAPMPEQPPTAVFSPYQMPQLDQYKNSFISTPEIKTESNLDQKES